MFYTEIQDGYQNWRENDFWEKSPVDCRYPVDQKFCRNCSSLLYFRDKHIFLFYAEIQDGRQKWRENDFGENLQVDCIYPSAQKFHHNRSSSHRF